jgi:hypothetical protein
LISRRKKKYDIILYICEKKVKIYRPFINSKTKRNYLLRRPICLGKENNVGGVLITLSKDKKKRRRLQ